MKRVVAAIAAAVAITMLAACGPQSVSDDQYGGWPEGIPPEEAINGDGPAAWDGQRLHVLLGGSSSCPTVPTAVDESAGMVRITIERSGGPLCTADMAYVTHVFRLAQGRPDSVLLVSEHGDFELEVRDVG